MRLQSLVQSFLALLLPTAPLAAQQATPAIVAPTAITSRSLPFVFEANQGQTGAEVKFITHGGGYQAFLTADGLVLSLRANQDLPSQAPGRGTVAAAPANVQLKLTGANPNPVIQGELPQIGKVNYFIGRDPSQWRTNIPTFARVRYKAIYPGIDLVYYGSQRQLEYDFELSPGANPQVIQFQVIGASDAQIGADGTLDARVAAEHLHFQSPQVYQVSGGTRVPVSGAYVRLDASHIGFRVAPYDATKPLVIDPLVSYSTYLGGSGSDQPSAIATDSSGNLYIAGYTTSTDFPSATIGSLPAGNTHAFVAKLDPTGANLLWADYIGGNSDDYGFALALDSSNDVYIVGSTASSNFPLVNPYQGIYPGSYNGFFTKLSANGASLLYSTYLGGNGSDQPTGIVVDSQGEAVVAGNTSSTNFPVAYAYQSTVSPNLGNNYGTYGFVTKFSADGSYLVYSTYLGGSENVSLLCGQSICWPSPTSGINGIALDPSGSAYVAGTTNTYNFPFTDGSYQTTNTTPNDSTVGFLSKFSSSGSLDYSTYFYESSGLLTDVNAVAVDASGSAYITGAAFSDGTFPITSTTICNPTISGTACGFAFVTKFDSTGEALLYSTFLGVNNWATPKSIALDSNNDAYIAASTTSSSFSIVNGIEQYAGGSDVLLVEIDPLATTQLFATYLGGSVDEYAEDIAIAADDSIYVTGSTDSTDFPVTPGGFQPIYGGNTDAFVIEVSPTSDPSITLNPSSLQFPAVNVGSLSQPQTILVRNLGSSQLSIASITPAGDFSETNNCGSSLAAAGSCNISVTFAPTTGGARSGTISLQNNAAGSPQTISLSGIGNGPSLSVSPASLQFSPLAVGSSSAAKAVTVSNAGNEAASGLSVATTGSFSQTNTCGSSLSAGSSCTVEVVFSPSAAGSLAGTLTIAGSGPGDTASLPLTGTGADFSLSVSSNSASVNPGQTATYHLNVASSGAAFSGSVALVCSGTPAQTTCSVSPSQVTPGNSSANSTLTVTTTAASSSMLAAPQISGGRRTLLAVWLQLPGVGLFGLLLKQKKGKRNQWLALLALAILATLCLSACAGGTGIASQSGTGTAAGTYTLTVTGSAGSIQHTLHLTLIVQ